MFMHRLDSFFNEFLVKTFMFPFSCFIFFIIANDEIISMHMRMKPR